MNIIKSKTVLAYGKQFPDAKESHNVWLFLMEMHSFQHLPDIRKVFPSANPVGLKKELICFNIHGNKYRLIIRITFPKTVFVKEFLTHKEYCKKYPY